MRNQGQTRAAPTVADVARHAGVSKATAARVLGGYGSVGEQMRDRVQSAAIELTYRPNQLARSIATGRSETIGVIIGDIENLNFARAVRAIIDTASAHGFLVILMTTDEDIALEREAIRILLAKRVDGMIIVPTSSSEIEHLTGLVQRGFPVVLVGRRFPAVQADTFSVDEFGASYNAVRSLIRRGHRRIALLSTASCAGERQFVISSNGERIDGYRAALSDAKIEVPVNFTVLGGRNTQYVAKQVHELCVSSTRPTAILATNDSAALVLFNVLRQIPLSIPEDVSLICLDDADWTGVVTPPVTVVSRSIYDLARAAAERLFARLSGQTTGLGEETIFHAVLSCRASVRDI
ncbi:LacI family DNA-binding transcriptional regulator [Rhizobium bangladeshense]|uniref:LacI family DNA-binding transcriptional regulator n=1 Tax=Rhizobium bangladeshense TaxID=1138189 RepID=UPI0007E545E5|nr:LacI family DNA-binding transcriptional regulator [Rhizobium bangladeshense]